MARERRGEEEEEEERRREAERERKGTGYRNCRMWNKDGARWRCITETPGGMAEFKDGREKSVGNVENKIKGKKNKQSKNNEDN